MYWAYKYSSETPHGISIHGDQAAVNLNMWLTPDEANLDPSSGGLIIYHTRAPPSWGSRMYNRADAVAKNEMDNLLARDGHASTKVAYKSNRMVMFQSDLFHVSDAPFKFTQGDYTSGRLDLTLLYGERV